MNSVAARAEPTDHSSKPIRLDSLTGLRWWAAFAVFAFHMKNLAPLPIDDILRLGNSGVAFFFILSGFVLTWSARPGTAARTFWWRRFARIWPAHIVALLLAIPVFYSFTPNTGQPWIKEVSVGVLLLSVVLLQGWSRDTGVFFSGNPAAWTLTCEAFFYTLHPAINRVVGLVTKRGALIVGCAVLMGIFAFRAAEILWPSAGLASVPVPVARLGEFVLGMAIARAMRCGWMTVVRPLWCYTLGGGMLLWLGLAPRWVDGNPAVSLALTFTGPITIAIFATTIAVAAANDLRQQPSVLRSRMLVALGDMSYAFYLVHATVIYALLNLFGVREHGWWNLGWYFIVLSVSLAFAWGLHYYVEKPIERRMRSWWDRRRRPQGVAAPAKLPTV